MSEWESALAARDSTFTQLFFLSLLITVIYQVWFAPDPRRRSVALTVGILLFLGLFIFSVALVLSRP